MSKLVRLTRGQVAIVDDEDFELVMQFRWQAFFKSKTCYAKTGRKGGTQYMHALIMRTPKGMETHHKNGNGLDNRRENLEILDKSAHRRLGAKTGPKPGWKRAKNEVGSDSNFYIYPYFYKDKPVRYRVFLKDNGTLKHYGYFDSYAEADAACHAAAMIFSQPLS